MIVHQKAFTIIWRATSFVISKFGNNPPIH